MSDCQHLHVRIDRALGDAGKRPVSLRFAKVPAKKGWTFWLDFCEDCGKMLLQRSKPKDVPERVKAFVRGYEFAHGINVTPGVFGV